MIRLGLGIGSGLAGRARLRSPMREARALAHLHLHLGRVQFEPCASIIASVSIVERVNVVLFRLFDLVRG